MQATVPVSSTLQTTSTVTNQTALSTQTINMALVPAPPSETPLFAEVDMCSDSSATTVRATVVQASTVFYDTPATLGTSIPYVSKEKISFLLLVLMLQVLILVCVKIRLRDCWLKQLDMGLSWLCFLKHLLVVILEDQVLVLSLVVVQLKGERISESIMLQPLMFLVCKTKIKVFPFMNSFC